MLHTAFHSVFKLYICLIPTPFCYFQLPISPMNGSVESHIGINAVAFVSVTKKLLTRTFSLTVSSIQVIWVTGAADSPLRSRGHSGINQIRPF